MNNTNYISSIVKILENPRKKISKNTVPITYFRAEISQIKKNRILYLIFHGNLAENVYSYYQGNDYLLIEGYLATKKNSKRNNFTKNLKKIEINVVRVYPLYLNLDRQKAKTKQL